MVEQLESYVSGVLHTPLRLVEWERAATLPPFLRAEYRFYTGRILDAELLFCLSTQERPAGVVGKHRMAIGERWSDPVVFAFERISPHNRKRMIEAGIPFVVAGTQLYLPMLAIDLRERFKPQSRKRERLSPSAQVVLLHALWDHRGQANTPTGLRDRLGYTIMTMGRSLDQLEAAGLVRVKRIGRERFFEPAEEPALLWRKAQPLLASPVRRRILFECAPPGMDAVAPVSGLTALAHYSDLAAPRVTVRAMYSGELPAWEGVGRFRMVPSVEEAWLELEVWSYSPRLFSTASVVDQLSLYLALRNDSDERVSSALEDMMGRLSW